LRDRFTACDEFKVLGKKFTCCMFSYFLLIVLEELKKETYELVSNSGIYSKDWPE
jgi:hypothetical protein